MHWNVGYNDPTVTQKGTLLANVENLHTHMQNTFSKLVQSWHETLATTEESGRLDRTDLNGALAKLQNGHSKRQQRTPRKLVSQPVATPEAYGLSSWNV